MRKIDDQDPSPGSERDDLERSELIDSIYDAALDPDGYDRFMDAWAQHLARLVDQPAYDPLGTGAGDGELQRHFERAERLSSALRSVNPLYPSSYSITENDPLFSVVVKRDGGIVSLSPTARLLLGADARLDALEELLDTESLTRLRRALQSRPADPDGTAPLTLLRMAGNGSQRTVHLSLSAANIAGGGDYLVIRAVEAQWSSSLETALREGFGLTAREVDIMRQLVSGQSLNEISESEGRSLNTLRTQLKSVLKKTTTTSQPELVRLLTSIGTMLPGPTGGAERPVHHGERKTMRMRDGRNVPVNVHGPPDGRAVVFVHGMLDGISVTERISAALASDGIRLICPARPNFGTSDPLDDRESAPSAFASDLREILDQLGIGRALILGHKAGSVYAFAAAAALPDRISGILVVSGGVPIISRRQFQLMKPRQQIVALTARYAPRLLPWILRKGIAQIRSGGERAFMDALYRNAPHDHLVASSPDTFPVIRDGYHFTVAQGPKAFEIDAYHVTRDWSDHVRAAKQPVVVLHGALDPVVDIETVREFAQSHPGIELDVLEQAGQLLFYEFPEIVHKAVLRLVGQAKATGQPRQAG